MNVLSLLLLLFWLLALGRTLLNLFLVPRLSPDASTSAPLVSIVIPARNESRVIERTVRAFLDQDYPNFEVIVVDDRSSDGTAVVLKSIDDPRLMVVAGEEPPPEWLGKPWALEQGSRRARGQLLLFADADIIYARAALRAAVGELLRNDASLLALLPYFEMRGFAENVGVAMLPFTIALLPVWLSNRTRFGALAIGGGAGNLVRRSALEQIGYFVALKQAVVDDVALAQCIRRMGGITRAVRAENLIRVRMYHGAREIIDGFTKNAFFAFGPNYAKAFTLLIVVLVTNLYPYVLALSGDWIGLATVAVIALIRVVAFRSMGYGLLNALFLHPLTIVFWAYIFLRSMWFTGVRKELRWRGRIYDAAQTRFGA